MIQRITAAGLTVRIGSIVPVAMLASALALSPAFILMPPAEAQTLRERLKERIRARAGERTATMNLRSKGLQEENIAGLKVAIWVPQEVAGPWPIVFFSHGFHGINRQSEFICEALADAGYFVVAPNHDDAIGSGKGFGKTEQKLGRPDTWDENTYKKRGQDITRLLAALKEDPQWRLQIDWSKVVLMGHSLGGYTMLALAGAWPSWKLPDAIAVVALSPYANPFITKQTLQNINIPVMYQTGTTDFGVAPFLKAANGGFKMTPSPVYLVDVVGANHFTWTNLNRQKSKADLIDHYVLAFLDKFVKGDPGANPGAKLPGINELWQR